MQLKKLYSIFTTIFNQLCFKSGAINDDYMMRNKKLEKKYYLYIKKILKNLIDKQWSHFILPQTTHHILKMLDYMLEYDTSYIIKLISNILINTKSSGYVYDNMAIEEIIKIMEKVLCDYKGVMKDNNILEHVVNILDCFADIGSQKALDFVWKLEDIYR